MEKNNYKEMFEWIYVCGFNYGLISQKLFQIRERVLDFQHKDDESENFREELLNDINYLSDIIDKD